MGLSRLQYTRMVQDMNWSATVAIRAVWCTSECLFQNCFFTKALHSVFIMLRDKLLTGVGWWDHPYILLGDNIAQQGSSDADFETELEGL